MSSAPSNVDPSLADVWYLKQVQYGPNEDKRTYRIITQNFNGPCSFIAICNILILRGDITIQPPERKTVSYEFLSHLVAEHLLQCSPNIDVSDALSIMPVTQKGMDLNPVFTSSTAFRPSGGGGGELKLFEHVGIKLVHGWLVDAGSQEAKALERAPDYDTAVGLIAEVDHLTNGKFVVDESALAEGPVASGSSSNPMSPSRTLTDKQHDMIADAIVVREFLEHSQSQLTFSGLFQLVSELETDSLVALFRNSHLSVLVKKEEVEGPALYSLVTDQVFLREPSVVWERLEDVDGGWSTFVDSDFVRSSPAGGDFAGQTAEDALRAMESMNLNDVPDTSDPQDRALAAQLQAEEEYLARREREEYRRQEHERRQAEQQQEDERRQDKHKLKKKKSKDCIIM
ncbi:hypothetical protein BKA70DRAFT_1385931 [Coprinopsis sp. MPI-PUGE-AT-0042]|nr:hypothetical protein BKA70DRAFT_1385931 [Coprinopsis sp. MPI-PUGE-AT-0042]